ncbi:hypothetical protein OG379_40355 (plasmid) [Streptomyces sp. NBC_01166]|uniref:hypothetical protein n=1 Tax=Streptomyces sp. NBC_01166 TaxID=2903755 RepID=UPI003863BC53|nr:hypothetical protein OG379_40355 [Streptomyces sp. NBC_01166]
MTRASTRLEVSYGQYWIVGDVFDVTEWDYTGFNGLIASLNAPGGLAVAGQFAVIMTGTETGGVFVTVDVRREPPADVDVSRWDDVVEVSLSLPGDQPIITADGPDTGLPDLTEAQPGPFRVRVHARGRDAGYERVMVYSDEAPVEEHLVIIWPATTAPEITHKLTDQVGKEIRCRPH